MRILPLLVVAMALGGCAADASNSLTDERRAADTDPSASAKSPKKVAEFQGEYRFLSNFWPATIDFEGITYPTVEHAYQAAKTLDINQRRRIAALPTPSDAKRQGRALALRADWEHVKFDVMEGCVREKFTRHADLRAALLSTGDAPLEEGNTWGDRVWGIYEGQGENRLGKILMKVRQELRAETASGEAWMDREYSEQY
jgi:ribA/ribD-fused uncharacterized protein